MVPWEYIDCADVPGAGEALRLYRRGGEYAIRVGGYELMNSRMHGSEEALAEIACKRIAGRRMPKVLIGGLGMGFTVAAALRNLNKDARVYVAELAPKVVAWNKWIFGHLAGNPLNDSRVSVCVADVAALVKPRTGVYDAVLLDVDNGPDGLIRVENNWLYGRGGLAALFAALRPSGFLAVWSAATDPAFTRRLQFSGYQVETVRVRARGRRGGRHVIWLAGRPPV